MTSSIRTTLSAATALGLVSFTATSALLSGPFATATLVGFAFLAVRGVLEIAILSYAAPRPLLPRPVAKTAVPVRVTRRVPALIEFTAIRRTAACRPIAA